jgi:hypothetical protein
MASQLFGRPLSRIWRSTTENAIWIFYAINTLFTVTDTILLYMTIITVVGMILYYVNAFITLEDTSADEAGAQRIDWLLFLRKIWRITEANGIWLACGVSAIFYLEGMLFIYSTIMTIIGFGLFYIYAYQTTELYDPATMQLRHDMRTIAQNLWKITEANILTVAGTISLLLFVTGSALVSTSVFVGIGFVMFYIDAYRLILSEEANPTTDDESTDDVDTISVV